MEAKNLEALKNSIRDVPDFPKAGILFKDLTTAFKKPEIFSLIVDEVYELYKYAGITKVIGIESRGFIIGSALADRLKAGFVPIRKPGKLPAEVYSKSYALEYGEDTLDIHKDALTSDDVVLLHDDLLATGGTAQASVDLINNFNVKNIKVNFIVELGFLNGREKIQNDIEVTSILKY